MKFLILLLAVFIFGAILGVIGFLYWLKKRHEKSLELTEHSSEEIVLSSSTQPLLRGSHIGEGKESLSTSQKRRKRRGGERKV